MPSRSNRPRTIGPDVSPLMEIFYPNCRTTSSTGPRRGANSTPASGARMALRTARTIPASQHFSTLCPSGFACQHGGCAALSARFRPIRPSLSAFQLRPPGNSLRHMLNSASRFQRLALELLLQIQPLADIHKPGGDQGSLPRDFHVTLRFVESQGAQVVTCDVQTHGLLARVPGEIFRRRKQASPYPLAAEGGSDHQPFDVGFRSDGGVCRVGEQGRRPDGPRKAEVARESSPQAAGEDVFPGDFGPDADAAGDLPVCVPFDNQGSYPPEVCSRRIQRSITLSERSILPPKTCLNWSRNPSTTRAAIAWSSSGRARRTVNCSASIGTSYQSPDLQPMSRLRMIWTGIKASAPVNTRIQATSTSTPTEGPVASSLHTLTA